MIKNLLGMSAAAFAMIASVSAANAFAGTGLVPSFNDYGDPYYFDQQPYPSFPPAYYPVPYYTHDWQFRGCGQEYSCWIDQWGNVIRR